MQKYLIISNKHFHKIKDALGKLTNLNFNDVEGDTIVNSL